MPKYLIAAVAWLPLAALAAEPEIVVLDVQKMTCELCPLTVRKSLEQVPGVQSVKVDFDKKTATVSYDPDKVKIVTLTQATANAGYPSNVHR